MRTRYVRMAGLMAVMMVALLGLTTMRPVSAQDATPTADMGSCTAALGIGAEGDACVNIIHASPDAPAVDLYIDGALALENLPFNSYSGWVALPAGDHQVQVSATGTPADQAVIDANVTLEAGAAYQVAATGLLANITPAIFQTNLSEFAGDTAGNARIRVIHASPDAPAVDVALKGGDVLVPNLAFPNASDYLEVPAGTYDLEVRAAGTDTVALPLDGVVLEAGLVYDVYATGLLGDNTLGVLVIASPGEGTMMATPTS